MANKIKKIDSLNLIPFIDIMLVLLVIVLTTATFIQQNRLNVEVPKVADSAGSSKELSKNEKIISIKNDNSIFFDDSKVTLEQLKFHISRLPKDTSIVLNGDRMSNFEVFVKIMAMLENLQFSNLYILLDKDAKSHNQGT